MTSTQTQAVLSAARRLFGLTDAEVEKLAADPEELLALEDILESMGR